MDFLNICNGYRLGSPRFSQTARSVFQVLVAQARIDFKEAMASETGPGGRYELGYRFENNDDVLTRIESATTEDEFLGNARAWILDGLRECASADHWYTYEKQWD